MDPSPYPSHHLAGASEEVIAQHKRSDVTATIFPTESAIDHVLLVHSRVIEAACPLSLIETPLGLLLPSVLDPLGERHCFLARCIALLAEHLLYGPWRRAVAPNRSVLARAPIIFRIKTNVNDCARSNGTALSSSGTPLSCYSKCMDAQTRIQ